MTWPKSFIPQVMLLQSPGNTPRSMIECLAALFQKQPCCPMKLGVTFNLSASQIKELTAFLLLLWLSAQFVGTWDTPR